MTNPKFLKREVPEVLECVPSSFFSNTFLLHMTKVFRSNKSPKKQSYQEFVLGGSYLAVLGLLHFCEAGSLVFS